MLRALLDAPAGEMVDEVWAWEAVQHGDAAILNAANLSGICASLLLIYVSVGDDDLSRRLA